MRKALPLWVDQSAKLNFLSDKLGLTTLADWKRELGLSNQATASKWKSGSGVSGLYEKKILRLIEGRGYSVDLYHLKNSTIRRFRQRFGEIDDGEGIAARTELADSPHALCIAGRYLAAFLSRNPARPSEQIVSLELFEIEREAQSGVGFLFYQLRNSETKNRESGHFYSAADRYCGLIHYTDFPPSVYYLCPVVMGEHIRVMTGIYTDITNEPNREIFSTRALFMSVPRTFDVEDAHGTNQYFEIISPILSNSLGFRTRLVAEPPVFTARLEIMERVASLRAALGIAPSAA